MLSTITVVLFSVGLSPELFLETLCMVVSGHPMMVSGDPLISDSLRRLIRDNSGLIRDNSGEGLINGERLTLNTTVTIIKALY